MLTYLFTYSIQQSSSWETNQFSASQEIPRILWNLKVHYRFHRCLQPVPILSQLDSVHTPTSHFWRSIIILSSHLHLGLLSGLFPLWFPHQNPVRISPILHMCCMPHTSHFLCLIIQMIFCMEYRSLRWSWWPHGLRCGSADARLRRLWVWIPLGAWMSVCCECCVLSGRGLCDGLITCPEESYQLVCHYVWSRNLVNEEALSHWGLSQQKLRNKHH